ncbi:NAD(+) kinase, partial [Blyttiomyces sp. JEL0837]
MPNTVPNQNMGIATQNSGSNHNINNTLHPTTTSPTNSTGSSATTANNINNKISTPTQKLAETSVEVRQAAKSIGKILVKLEKPATVMIVAKAFDVKNLIELYPHYLEKMQFWSAGFCAKRERAEDVDFIVTLGGDGTVLFTSWLFQHTQVPPVVPFHLGSLGFLTNFNITDIHDVMERIIGCSGVGVRINMRMRLSCTVWRCGGRVKGGDNLARLSAGPTSATSTSHRTSGAASNAAAAKLGGVASANLARGLRKASFTGSLPSLEDDKGKRG